VPIAGKLFAALQYQSSVFTRASSTVLGYSSTEVQHPFMSVSPRTVSKPVDVSWLFKAIACGRNECSKEALTALISGLSDLLLNRSYEAIDLVLRSILNFQLSPEALLAIARTSFAARRNLREWAGYVASMREEFRRRGLDANRLAQGLY
jgi:hypothetical protein